MVDQSLSFTFLENQRKMAFCVIWLVIFLFFNELQFKIQFLQVCGYVESPTSDAKVPYIIGVLPVLQVSSGGPQQYLREVMTRWGTLNKPHFVADSAFGSLEMLQEIKDWGGSGTLACSPTVNSYLWDALSLNLPPSHSRNCINSTSDIAAGIRVSEDSSTYQRVLSTGWYVDTESCTEEEEEEESSDSSDESNIVLFSKETLEEKKVKELREICKKYGIKTGRRKADTIANILKRSNLVNRELSAVEKMVKNFQTAKTDSEAPLNEFYRRWFNLVDLADRRWYSVEEHHKNNNWESKMLYAMLRYGAMNCWVKASSVHYRKYKAFREEIIKGIFQCQ